MKRKQSRWRSFCFAVKKNKHLGQLTFQQEQTQNISAHFIKIITENYRERQSASVGNIIQNKNLLQILYEKQVNHFTQEVRTASLKGIWPHSRNTLMEANTILKNGGAIMSKEISGIKKRSLQSWASIWTSEVWSLKRASKQKLPSTLNSFERFDEFLQGLYQYYEDSRWHHAGGMNSNAILHIPMI